MAKRSNAAVKAWDQGERGGKPERVQGILQAAFRQYGLDRQIARYNFVLQWPKIVGPEIAKRSRPEALEHGVLVVRVCDSSWAQELSFQKDVILSRLKRNLTSPEIISDVRFYVDGRGRF